MFAVDSSSFIAYFNGEKEGADTELITSGLKFRDALWLPPAAVTEILSSPNAHLVRDLINTIPLLEITPDYWERAAATRRILLQKKLKAHLADALIAQSCIDAGATLITRDADFAYYAKWAGLKIGGLEI